MHRQCLGAAARCSLVTVRGVGVLRAWIRHEDRAVRRLTVVDESVRQRRACMLCAEVVRAPSPQVGVAFHQSCELSEVSRSLPILSKAFVTAQAIEYAPMCK